MMGVKEALFNFVGLLKSKNDSYFSQFRVLGEDPPQSSLRNAYDYAPPEPESFEAWIWNSLCIMIAATPFLLVSLLIGRAAILFVVGTAFLLLALWSGFCFFGRQYLNKRADLFFERFLSDCAAEADAIYSHIGAKVKIINERTASYLLSLEKTDAQEVLVLVSLQGAVGDVIKKVNAYKEGRHRAGMAEGLRLLRSPLKFGVSQSPPVTLLNSPGFLDRKLKHLDDRLTHFENARGFLKVSND